MANCLETLDVPSISAYNAYTAAFAIIRNRRYANFESGLCKKRRIAMHALIGFLLSVTITLTLGVGALALLSRRRRYAYLMADGAAGNEAPDGTVLTVGSPRNDAGETGKDEELMDTDTRAALAEVIATYGAHGSATGQPEPESYLVDERPIVRIANTILQQAIKERASEIHLESDARGMRVRYRIDGMLHEAMQMPNYIKEPLIGRYRVLADVDLLENRLPQTGQIGTRFQGKIYDLNLNFLPTRYGVTANVRIYDQSSVRVTLNKLGFTLEMQSSLETLVARPTGLLMLAGPEGSGRGTLAYCLLNSLNTIERNIMTIEERPGFQISGLTQSYLDRPAGRTLPKVMDALRQHNPDVIFIGVDATPETLRIALEAAQSRLVIATMNASDTLFALVRLIGSGVEPALVASTLSGILALRLARRACPHCKQEFDAPATELRRFGFEVKSPADRITLTRGTKCDFCRQSGYRGQIGIYELLRNAPWLSDRIARTASSSELRLALAENEVPTLHEDALTKVLQGLTTLEEASRILPQ
jgi:type IV pilus assembly protein PilB